MKKTIVIIASDKVDLPVKGATLVETPTYANYEHISGRRSLEFAKGLSEHFDVILLIPDIYTNTQIDIDYSQLPFAVDTYNFRVASWNWSQELDRKLKKAHFVIIQANSGAGLQNCAVLPSNVNLVVDGWSVLPLELPGQLLTHSKISRKVFWKKAIDQYHEVITRANCLLVANQRQFHYYEGLFYGINKHNYNSFQFSPILKVPFGIDQIHKKSTQQSKDLRLLWVGPIQSWDYPEILLKEFSNHDDILITFADIKSSTHSKVFNTYFKTFFDRIDEISNMSITSMKSIDLQDYDFIIHLTRNWIISSYLHKVSILDSISYGCPVITNAEDCLYDEITFLRNSMYVVDNDLIAAQIQDLKSKKTHYQVSDSSQQLLEDTFKWKNVMLPLVDYLYNF